MVDFAVLALALWIITHTVASEIPLTARARKPFSCQLCLAGWVCIAAEVCLWLITGNVDTPPMALAIWGATVLIERVYQRMGTVML